MQCPYCTTPYSTPDKFCQTCGASLKEPTTPPQIEIHAQHVPSSNATRKKSPTILYGIIAALSLFIGGMWFASRDAGPDTSSGVNSETSSPVSRTELIEKTQPKVFTILTDQGTGSGFLYKKGGFVVTNAHVVEGYSEVTIRNSLGEESYAQVVGISDTYDLALLQSDDYKNANPLATEHMESAVGLEVVALGSPQGFENSASIGYITGKDRDIEYGYEYEKLYQVDAQIDAGSSGGPLVDLSTGKVIGINSLLYENSTTFAFSIPLYLVTDILDDWAQNPLTLAEIEEGGYEETYEEETYSDEEYYYEEDIYDFSYSFTNEFVRDFPWGDFEYVSSYLYPSSEAYKKIERMFYEVGDSISEIEVGGFTVDSVEIYDDYAVIELNLWFDYYDDDYDPAYKDLLLTCELEGIDGELFITSIEISNY